jgi:hypothetical protein
MKSIKKHSKSSFKNLKSRSKKSARSSKKTLMKQYEGKNELEIEEGIYGFKRSPIKPDPPQNKNLKWFIKEESIVYENAKYKSKIKSGILFAVLHKKDKSYPAYYSIELTRQITTDHIIQERNFMTIDNRYKVAFETKRLSNVFKAEREVAKIMEGNILLDNEEIHNVLVTSKPEQLHSLEKRIKSAFKTVESKYGLNEVGEVLEINYLWILLDPKQQDRRAKRVLKGKPGRSRDYEPWSTE